MADKKTCFVVMGFGEKTDYKTSRVLDLNKTYRHIIKKAVEDAGLTCVRADEIPHAGTIDAPMYEMLLDADLVIADLSTSNLNAAYELGIRHALKPATTIIIAESQFDAPFDVNHVTIRKYRHDGKALDIDEVNTFRSSLAQAIKDVMVNGRVDSPVYTFLQLQPPGRRQALLAEMKSAAERNPPPGAAAAAADAAAPKESLGTLMELARDCKADGDWAGARRTLAKARKIAPHDVFVVQQLALATYKSKQPDAASALHEARSILQQLNPLTANDAETLGLWGAVHKRLFDVTGDAAALDTSIQAHGKGYWLLNDHYNGINLAFLLDLRAARQADRADAIGDAVQAQQVRRAVSAICAAQLQGLKDTPENRSERYWILASHAEAALGDGLPEAQARSQALMAQAETFGDASSLASTREQLAKLRPLLAVQPLQWVRRD
jgi:hypothetical protein